MDQPTWIGRTLRGRYRIDALVGQARISAVYFTVGETLQGCMRHLVTAGKFTIGSARQGCTVKFKGKDINFEGWPQDLDKLLKKLEKGKKRK